MNPNVYRCCIVRQCKNTSIKTPNKLFIYVPMKKSLRNTWLKLARRDPALISPNSVIYLCEDHFDLPNDMENYMKYHIMGSVSQVRMKPGCVPTRFECFQSDRKKHIPARKQPNVERKKRKILIEDVEEDLSEIISISTEHLESAGPLTGNSELTEAPEPVECVTCSKCLSPIPASHEVYRCVQCACALLCASCQPRAHRHRAHCLMRLPSTRVYEVLEGLFNQLRLDVDQLLSKHEDLLSNDDTELSNDDTELSNVYTEIKKEDTELSHFYIEIKKEDSELSNNYTEIKKEDSELSNDDTELKKDDTELRKDDTELSNDDTELSNINTEFSNNDIEIKKEDSELRKDDDDKDESCESQLWSLEPEIYNMPSTSNTAYFDPLEIVTKQDHDFNVEETETPQDLQSIIRKPDPHISGRNPTSRITTVIAITKAESHISGPNPKFKVEPSPKVTVKKADLHIPQDPISTSRIEPSSKVIILKKAGLRLPPGPYPICSEEQAIKVAATQRKRKGNGDTLPSIQANKKTPQRKSSRIVT